MQGVRVPSLVGELRSHMPCSAAEKKKCVALLRERYFGKTSQIYKAENVGLPPRCELGINYYIGAASFPFSLSSCLS